MIINSYSPFLNSINFFLNLKKNGIYIDCTLGNGGHSLKILDNLDKNGVLFSFDRDLEAINNIFKIKNRDKRFTVIHSNFSYIKKYMDLYFLSGKVNGILFDLGMSSYQLDNPLRGFSFMKNGPLDMRMNVNDGLSAECWINKASQKEIYYVIKKYGEENYAWKISKKIIMYRKKKRIKNTFDLSKIINSVVGFKNRKNNPSTKTFQAIRIFLNRELYFLFKGLNAAYDILAPKGRLVVISFHSLEDRIVKNFIKLKSNINSYLLSDLPLTEKQININYPLKMKNLGKFKPLFEEIKVNPRIRSAILRVAEKI